MLLKSKEEMANEIVENIFGDYDFDKERKQEFIKDNTMIWLENGKRLKSRRDKHGFSLKEVGERLGTSESRIRRLEIGEPVSMADHLTTCYNLLFDHIELKKSFKDFYSENGLNWRV